jgi:predicted Rossmann-fold nucleotide-binding protein
MYYKLTEELSRKLAKNGFAIITGAGGGNYGSR